jgi:hypothetical protein
VTQILCQIDTVAEKLEEGFATHYLGRRGAVILFLILGSLVPLSSLSNLIWIAAYLALFVASDMKDWLAVAALFPIALYGFNHDLKSFVKYHNDRPKS